jgi:hypothetical protein
MVVPLPGPGEVLLERPTAEEAEAIAVGLASAAAPPGGLTEVQRVLLEATCSALTDHPIDLSAYDPVTPAEFGALLARRDLGFRTRGVQMMLLAAMVLRPLPPEVADRITAFACELGVDEGMVAVARELSHGCLGLAAVDFDRNGYTREWAEDDHRELHLSRSLADAWDGAVDDPDLAARWAALEDLPDGTLGRGVWQLYTARGFVFPGLPGSAPVLLAQHDWVHVLGDYGTTVESELEVFALIARANDDMRAFSLLAMVVSLFETGVLAQGAGLFQADAGHISGLSKGREMAIRIGDAMTRGAWCHDTVTGAPDVDFLRVDWFDLAPLPLPEARARFALRPRSDLAVAAGAVSAWEPGGISPFQMGAGRDRAARAGRDYESYGADLPGSPGG